MVNFVQRLGSAALLTVVRILSQYSLALFLLIYYFSINCVCHIVDDDTIPFFLGQYRCLSFAPWNTSGIWLRYWWKVYIFHVRSIWYMMYDNLLAFGSNHYDSGLKIIKPFNLADYHPSSLTATRIWLYSITRFVPPSLDLKLRLKGFIWIKKVKPIIV